MEITYRHILKWGDKREEIIDSNTMSVLLGKFGLDRSDIVDKHMPGGETVKLATSPKLKKEQIDKLKSIVGEENFHTDDSSRARFSCGKFYSELLDLRMGQIPDPPDAVIAPGSHEEVAEIVNYCNKEKIPLIPVGGQSSVTGALQAPYGGLAMDLSKHLKKIISINRLNKTVTVQAGMMGPDFENELNSHGFTCGHFPQSFEYSSVGGWIAAKGAGQASTGYGKIEDMVVSLKVVTPAGVIETKSFPRAAQGWDIFRLFIGAEGTLGVITEATINIHYFKPENSRFASFVFKSFEDGVEAMRTMIQSEYGKPFLFRLSDPEETDIAFKTKGFDNTLSDRFLKMLGFQPGKRTLMLLSVDGDKEYTRFVRARLIKSAKKKGGFYTGSSPVVKWLETRYSSAYLRDPLMDLGIMTDTLETAVTWENLLMVWKAAHDYAHTRPKTVLMIHISHVYESGANLYFTFLSPMEKGNEKDDFTGFHSGLVETILANGGSLSHHHGVGRVLGPRMEAHLGKESMEVMRAVKKHFDPGNIMNPGSILGI